MISRQETAGLAERPRSTDGRGQTPPFLSDCNSAGIPIVQENILSVFVDESGDFGPYKTHSPYYIIALVFHKQSNDISGDVQKLDVRLKNWGFANHTIHAGPLIRRESVYKAEETETRKQLFRALFQFTRIVDFKYVSIKLRKTTATDKEALTAHLSNDLKKQLALNEDFFLPFDKIIIYCISCSTRHQTH